MNNNGFREFYKMRLRLEAHRYMKELFIEFKNREIVEEDAWWIWELYEDGTHFLYDLKHKPETYNMPARERVDLILMVVVTLLRRNSYNWRGMRSQQELLHMVYGYLIKSNLEEKYFHEMAIGNL